MTLSIVKYAHLLKTYFYAIQQQRENIHLKSYDKNIGLKIGMCSDYSRSDLILILKIIADTSEF